MVNKIVEIAQKQSPLGTVTWGDLAHMFKEVRDEEVQVTLPVKPSFDENEIELIKHLALQKETKEIAMAMGITPHAVEQIRLRLRGKMNVKNSVGIVMYAVKYNLIRVE